MKSFLKRRQVINYINLYEKNEMGLIKDDMYEMRKSSLLRQPFVKLKDFKEFIDDTKNFPSTGFYYGEQHQALKNSFIPKKSVYQLMYDDVLHCKLHSFSKTEVKKMQKQLSKFDSAKYLILDLRDNFIGDIEGGFLLLNCLTKNCELFKIRYKLREERFFSDRQQYSYERIYIVLNERSELISELVTLALKHHLDNVTVVGSKTINQRIGQEEFLIEKNTVLKLSSYRWDAGDIDIEDVIHRSIKDIQDVYDDIMRN